MPQTIHQTHKGQIIGGIFSTRENADKAVAAFRDMDIAPENIQLVVKLNDHGTKDSYTGLLIGRGLSESQALYHNRVVREGKVFVAVYEVENPGPIIDIFNKYKAEHNPNGSRNLRHDVLGMTTGAMAGAAALAVVGAVVAGPVGAVSGLAAGAVGGAASGATAGTVTEHNK